jgi:flagellar biosynthesis/type III secretory pathway protein FliH
MTTTEVTVGGVQAVTTVQTTAVDAKKRKSRAKRRTFKEVAKDAYERGFAEGVDLATKNAREELDRMSEANIELARTVLALETRLANVSLRELAWSRITALFGGKP